MQQTRPKYRARHVRDFAPVHTGRQSSTDNTAHARAGHDGGFDSAFVQGLDNPDVREPAHSATAESQTNAFGLQ